MKRINEKPHTYKFQATLLVSFLSYYDCSSSKIFKYRVKTSKNLGPNNIFLQSRKKIFNGGTKQKEKQYKKIKRVFRLGVVYFTSISKTSTESIGRKSACEFHPNFRNGKLDKKIASHLAYQYYKGTVF